ncbi:MAG: hypothetical protein EOP83_08645 [Verrucomicrobiaceae bacterium]|nr:MAG: hypothetical protein EOP83_08645 [Verrucomicrobiaceae bacterium]
MNFKSDYLETILRRGNVVSGETTIRDLSVNDDCLTIHFYDGRGMVVQDVASNCCETRYMTCDDDLEHFRGSFLLSVEVRDGGSVEDDNECHDVEFMIVTTNLGSFTIASHNLHNGYYSGFDVVVKPLTKTGVSCL